MRYLHFIVLLLAAVVLSSGVPSDMREGQRSSYDVAAVYVKQKLPSDSKVIDNYGNLKEARYLLVKTEIDYGDYSVEVKRADQNLYEVRGTDLYIETKYCYEYSYNDKAILTINSRYGYTVGKLTFVK